VERIDDLLLQVTAEVDQQVAARDHVQPRERRIPQQAVAGEQHHVPQFAADAVMVALALEETPQPILGDIGFDGGGEPAFPRHRQARRIEIGTEHLDFRLDILARRLLQQQDGDAVGFLAGGASGDPDADVAGGFLAFEQPGDDVPGEHLERLRIAEERGDRDQEIGEQRLGFLNVVAQVGVVFRQRVLARDLHPPGDPAQDGCAFVLGKIVTQPDTDVRQDPPHHLLVALAQRAGHPLAVPVQQFHQTPGEPVQRQHEIGHLRGDRAARHRGIFRLGRILDQDDAAGFLDGLDADGAIRARAGQDDGEAVAVLCGERPEELVDRRTLGARVLERQSRDHVVGNAKIAVRRDHINAIVL